MCDDSESSVDVEEPVVFPSPRDPRCPFDPPPALMELRDRCPVSRIKIWNGTEPWFVTRYEDARTVFSDSRFSADATRDGYPQTTAALAAHRTEKMLLTMDPPEHTQLRRLLATEFMFKRMDAMRPRVVKRIDDLFDDLVAHGPPIDFVKDFSMQVPALVVSEMLGVPDGESTEVLNDLVNTMTDLKTTAEQGHAVNEAYASYLDELVGRKIEQPGDDIISRMIKNLLEPGQLTRRELVVTLRLIVIAGFESTANATALGVLLLLGHPEQRDALREDPSLAASAIEEILRFASINHMGHRRVATVDLELHGQQIDAGEGVMIATPIVNRDPDAFDDPDTFDIRRDARDHLAFGYGPHQCLGQALARIELETIFARVFVRFPNLRLAVNSNELTFKEDKTLYGVHEMPVTWDEPDGASQ
jgi:cytochrome P450